MIPSIGIIFWRRKEHRSMKYQNPTLDDLQVSKEIGITGENK